MKGLIIQAILIAGVVIQVGLATDDSWTQAETHGKQTQRAIRFCNRHAHGWLSHADPKTGLLPRRVTGEQAYWNAADCAADNYPFITLTAHITDNYYLKQAVLTILEQEQKLTNRLDRLPDDFDFATQAFRTGSYDINSLIFGASEYAKDGLMPITEWMGPGPWLDRMEGLIRDIFKHAMYDSKAGKLPSHNVEVNGELMQVTSRLYWLTGNEDYKTWALRLADHYLLYESLLQAESIRLRDHGCEVVGGLSEAYVVASRTDADRWQKYMPAMHALLDRILEVGVNENGLMYNAIDPRSGRITGEGLCDTYGYVYNAYLTVAMVDGEERYRDAVRHVLENLHEFDGKDWAKSADEYADGVEGAINLLNRIPVPSAFEAVERFMNIIFDKQGQDGIIEGWYGDGNSARTALMCALYKTQGVTLAPWREDLELGAVLENDGTLRISMKTDWAWTGQLRFDRPRHREVLHLPIDYPRINQFPEWFTVEPDSRYVVTRDQEEPETVIGSDLINYPLSLKPHTGTRLTVVPKRDSASTGPANPSPDAGWQFDEVFTLANDDFERGDQSEWENAWGGGNAFTAVVGADYLPDKFSGDAVAPHEGQYCGLIASNGSEVRKLIRRRFSWPFRKNAGQFHARAWIATSDNADALTKPLTVRITVSDRGSVDAHNVAWSDPVISPGKWTMIECKPVTPKGRSQTVFLLIEGGTENEQCYVKIDDLQIVIDEK